MGCKNMLLHVKQAVAEIIKMAKEIWKKKIKNNYEPNLRAVLLLKK